MVSDKEIKKKFKEVASKDPDKYYPTEVLKKYGFKRKKCSCGIYFWTTTDSKVCGDSACSGGFRFFENNPAKEKLSYSDVWKKFSDMFSKKGYKIIKRYPVVARWNPTMDYTIASIACFQPYVISGESAPPAKQLVIPQFCLRFNDVDNVGITGSHMTGFVMIGQHAFVSPKEWNKERYFSDIKDWLNNGLGLPDKEITFHEDAWAGGGNFGPCIEYFSRGVELGNQVYMMYEQTDSGRKELQLKVLDMGMGMERNAWFSQGTTTVYDATFPEVMNKIRNASKLVLDRDSKNIYKKFVPYAGLLNIDETDDINKAWETVADKIDASVDNLRKIIEPNAALYCIAEHTRTLLVAINDGALPSNVGGGYNLRMLIRRCLDFIEKFKWNIYLPDVCRWHAEELNVLFPELHGKLDLVKEVLDIEKNKYIVAYERSQKIVEKLIQKQKDVQKEITTKQLLELYDSYGISPDTIKNIANKMHVKMNIPDNFYALVSELHEKKEQEHEKKKLDVNLTGIPETTASYYEDYTKTEFTGKIVGLIKKEKENYVLLKETYFYPTSGGQLNDTGMINGHKVVDVIKHGSHILHKVSSTEGLKEGSSVNCVIDKDRRILLAQHHTATHIVGAAARRILGDHVNQAGAKKTLEKAHLDITHYKPLTEEELEKIEQEANKLVNESLRVRSFFMTRDKAEKEYGTNIYQGGAVPGNNLRIIDISSVDVQCCGGTHLHNTKEAVKIKILSATKIQDGIIRLTFVAGKKAEEELAKDTGVLDALAKELNCKANQVPGRANELFKLWKDIVKKNKSIEKLELTSTEVSEGDAIKEASDILKTQEEHLVKTIRRFKKDIEEKIGRKVS